MEITARGQFCTMVYELLHTFHDAFLTRKHKPYRLSFVLFFLSFCQRAAALADIRQCDLTERDENLILIALPYIITDIQAMRSAMGGRTHATRQPSRAVRLRLRETTQGHGGNARCNANARRTKPCVGGSRPIGHTGQRGPRARDIAGARCACRSSGQRRRPVCHLAGRIRTRRAVRLFCSAKGLGLGLYIIFFLFSRLPTAKMRAFPPDGGQRL